MALWSETAFAAKASRTLVAKPRILVLDEPYASETKDIPSDPYAETTIEAMN